MAFMMREGSRFPVLQADPLEIQSPFSPVSQGHITSFIASSFRSGCISLAAWFWGLTVAKSLSNVTTLTTGNSESRQLLETLLLLGFECLGDLG
jgi:hypothetical protein